MYHKFRIKVYIASPYTKGNRLLNVLKQVDTANELMDLGFAPYAPLMNHYWEQRQHRQTAEWLSLDVEWLRVCHAILRLPGESAGADFEVKVARGMQIPVFYSVADLLDWRNGMFQSEGDQ